MGRPAKSIISSDDVELVIQPEGEEIEIIPVDQAKMAAFMEDRVQILIEMDDAPNSPVFVPAGHQGVTQYIRRGVVQTVKRKFLYSLLAAQKISFSCAFGLDATGNEFNRAVPGGKNTMRVNLIEDKNPLGGMKWVQDVMRETNCMPSFASV